MKLKVLNSKSANVKPKTFSTLTDDELQQVGGGGGKTSDYLGSIGSRTSYSSNSGSVEKSAGWEDGDWNADGMVSG